MNIFQSGDTALIQASMGDSTEIVKMLLAHPGIDLDLKVKVTNFSCVACRPEWVFFDPLSVVRVVYFLIVFLARMTYPATSLLFFFCSFLFVFCSVFSILIKVS